MNGKTTHLLEQANLNENESSISSAKQTFSDETESRRVFSVLKTKLSDINEWNKHALSCGYALFDETGNELQSPILQVGVLIRLSLTASGKYDWVKIINIDESADEFIITVKPTFDPTAEKIDKSVISHFFTDESTNNFCISRDEKFVGIYVIGLDEKKNTDETKNAVQTIRNVAVNAAVYFGMQKTEWEKFCHHFLEDAAAGK